jgi:hypothetical protein
VDRWNSDGQFVLKVNLFQLVTKPDIYFFPIFVRTIQQLVLPSSVIANRILPFISRNVLFAEPTIPYLSVKLKCYGPCPNPASHWKSIQKIFGSEVWACFKTVTILAVTLTWLLSKYEAQLHVRESANYNTIIYCIYNVWAVLTGVAVPQKPMPISLRIFFTAWVWYAVAMTTRIPGLFHWPASKSWI